jgi:endoglucanase
LGRGINLGNALDAPKEGEWGVTLQAEYFAKIKAAGFASVRLPVKWSAHCEKNAPYTIDAKFLERVDWALDQAEKNSLNLILNVHHYDEIVQDPAAHLPRLLGIWRQVASRYRDRPGSVYFEILNEPHAKLDDPTWNDMLPQLLAVIRATNPQRPVIIGPSQWNNVSQLPKLKLPADDRWLIATVHYYGPFEFTHQGAQWVNGSNAWKGRKWPQNDKEEQQLQKDFAAVAQWSKEQKRPVFLGEFGAFSAAEMESRIRWTQALVAAAEANGISWSYWEFCSGFGAYDPQKNEWRQPLLNALLRK